MPPHYPIRVTPGMVVRILADVALLQIAFIAAFSLRLFCYVVFMEESSGVQVREATLDYLAEYTRIAWPLTGVCLVVFYWNGFYTYGRYYQGRYKALVVAQAVSLSFIIFLCASYFFSNEQTVFISRGAIVLAWFLSVCLLVGARIWNQIWSRTVDPERQGRLRTNTGSKREILVIGGAGYIGSALLPKLLDKGHRVRLLDVLMFGEAPISKVAGHPNLTIIPGDFRHVENVVEAMRNVDSVIHLGAIVGDPACSIDEDLTIDVNLSATRMVAELARAAGVDRFIFASTCSVYGACDEVLDERSLVKPVSLYGHTKLASERVLRGMADDRFAPSIVRFATIYGLSGRTRFDLVVNLLTAKAKIDGEITVHGGDQWRPFVHVDDAARAVATILDAPKPLVANQTFNVGSNEQNYTINQIADLVHQQVVSATVQVTDGESDHRNYRVDFSKLRNQLNFQPQWTVQTGIQQVLEAIASGEVADYRDPKYSNVKFLTESGTSELARDNWARELIRDLASQQ